MARYHFFRREILICRAITVAELTTPKSGRSRSLHMTESLTTELFELLTFRRRQVLARGWKETPDWVFCSDVGSSIDPRNFSRIWERLRRRAQAEGIRPLKLHATRHTWASMALESGTNIRWVADQQVVQPREIIGGPSGTRTLDHRVKRTNRTQEVTPTYSSCLAGDCNRLQ